MTSILFNLDFANNTILSCFLFFSLIIALQLVIIDSHCTNFNRIADLITPIGIPIKEVKEEIEIQPVIVEAEIRKRLM